MSTMGNGDGRMKPITGIWSRVFAGFCAGAVFFAGTVSAQDDYPSKPITLLVGYAPGGSSDIQARVLADLVGKELRQRVLVENKAGMSAAIMLNFLARQKPDGYTVATTPAAALFGNPYMLKVDYAHTDFTYVSAFGRLLHAVSVRNDAPWKTFNELIAHAKDNPGKVKYATYAPNSTTFWLMRLLAAERGLDWTHVPYNSDAPAVQALLGGHVDAIAVASGQVPFVVSGQLRMLAVFNRVRTPQFPNVPTVEELGYKITNLTQMTSLTGIVAPKGFSGPAFRKLEAALAKAYRDPSFEAQMKNISSPIDLLDSKAYETEVAESAKIAEKIYPEMMKDAK